MAQTRYNCKNCRRLIKVGIDVCPYCGTVNNSEKIPQKTINNQTETIQQPRKNTSNNNKGVINIDELDNEYEEYVPSQENSDDVNASSSTDEQNENDENSSSSFAQELEEYDDDEDNTDVVMESDDLSISESNYNENTETNDSDLHETKRTIKWKDEKKVQTPDYTKMYNDKGVYNANFDGYYDDVLPKIDGELDKIMINKDKTFIKVVFSIVAIIAIIIFLVLTV